MGSEGRALPGPSAADHARLLHRRWRGGASPRGGETHAERAGIRRVGCANEFSERRCCGEGDRSVWRSERDEDEHEKSRSHPTRGPAAGYRPAARPRAPRGLKSSPWCRSEGQASANKPPPRTETDARVSQGLRNPDESLESSIRKELGRSGDSNHWRHGPTDGCSRRVLPWATVRLPPRASAMLRLRSLPIDDGTCASL
jgi:hypothetical protein